MADGKKRNVRIYEDEIDALLELKDDELARIMRALFCECLGREQPELVGIEKGMYKNVLAQVNRDRALCEKQRKNGQKGGRPKQTQEKAEETQANPTEIQTKPNRNPDETQTNPDETQQETEKTAETPKESALERRFNEFWAAYPKKQAKGAAFKTWKRLKPSQELTDKMIAAIEAQKRSEQWMTEGGRFIPNPATWLNGERWEDEITGGGTSAVNSGNFSDSYSYEQYAEGAILANDDD